MNSDLISRSELKEKVNAFYDSLFVGCVSSDLIAYASGVDSIIDNAPTVKTYCYFCGQTEHGQVVPDTLQGWKYEERPQGKWIYTPNIIGLSEYEGITCSICGDDSVGDFNFCPNCGAKMQKGGAE